MGAKLSSGKAPRSAPNSWMARVSSNIRVREGGRSVSVVADISALFLAGPWDFRKPAGGPVKTQKASNRSAMQQLQEKLGKQFCAFKRPKSTRRHEQPAVIKWSQRPLVPRMTKEPQKKKARLSGPWKENLSVDRDQAV